MSCPLEYISTCLPVCAIELGHILSFSVVPSSTCSFNYSFPRMRVILPEENLAVVCTPARKDLRTSVTLSGICAILHTSTVACCETEIIKSQDNLFLHLKPFIMMPLI